MASERFVVQPGGLTCDWWAPVNFHFDFQCSWRGLEGTSTAVVSAQAARSPPAACCSPVGHGVRPDLLPAVPADLLLSASRGGGGATPGAAEAGGSGSHSQAARREAAEALSPLFRRLRSTGVLCALPSDTVGGLGISVPVASPCPPSPHAPVAPPQQRCPRTAMSPAQKS